MSNTRSNQVSYDFLRKDIIIKHTYQQEKRRFLGIRKIEFISHSNLIIKFSRISFLFHLQFYSILQTDF